jgi:T5SS/PEP-CTERM-associated repeat protein
MGDTYSWNGGDGSFGDPSQWTDETNPNDTGVDAPGPGDTADFASGGAVTGSGEVADITVESTVMFNGNFSAGSIFNTGALDLTAGALSATSSGLNDLGSMTISGGASADLTNSSPGYASLGVGNGSANADLTVTGSGSMLTSNEGAVIVSGASMTVSDGGAADLTNSTPDYASLILGNGSAVADLTVTGLGSAVTTSNGGVDIGFHGTGSISILDGATFTASVGSSQYESVGLGYYTGDQGSLTISGAGSAFTLLNQGLSVGSGGQGAVMVSARGTLSFDVNPNNDLDIGQFAGATGKVTVRGRGSKIVDNNEL